MRGGPGAGALADGVSLPELRGDAYSRVRGGAHVLALCQASRHQTSLIAGTVMQGTKLPLTLWFFAIYLFSLSFEAENENA